MESNIGLTRILEILSLIIPISQISLSLFSSISLSLSIKKALGNESNKNPSIIPELSAQEFGHRTHVGIKAATHTR